MDFEYFDGDQRLLGVLEVPDAEKHGPGPYPGVVVVHEAWGLESHVKMRAKMLADRGYIALAADIFGDRHIPPTRESALELIGGFLSNRDRLRKRVSAAVTALRAHNSCDKRVAAIGYCFGGSTVLELARMGNPDVLGVVSFHGALSGGGPIGPTGVTAKVLVLHGAEDPLVPHEHLIAFLDEMAAAKADCQTICYTGAVHSFTNAEADGAFNAGILYHDRTDRRSWRMLMDFFDNEIFA